MDARRRITNWVCKHGTRYWLCNRNDRWPEILQIVPLTELHKQKGNQVLPSNRYYLRQLLENGFSPLTYMKSERTIFTYDNGRQEYEPKNVNGEFAGHPISMAQALAISDNIYAVKTLEQIGYKPFQQVDGTI